MHEAEATGAGFRRAAFTEPSGGGKPFGIRSLATVLAQLVCLSGTSPVWEQ